MLLAVALVGAGPAAAEVYKWVDKDGRTHYGDRSPRDGAEVVGIDAGPDAAERREAEARAQRLLERDARRTEMRRRQQARAATAAAERERASALRQRECALAQRDLALLRQQRPVYTTGPEGQDVFLDDAQRAVMIRRLETLVASNCVD